MSASLAFICGVLYSYYHYMKIAIIETGGKQHKVALGTKFKVEKLEGEVGASLVFDKVLLTVDEAGGVAIGAPYVEGAKVAATIVRQDRAKKVIVFKYHSKTRYRRKKGHRQYFTEVLVTNL